MKLALGIIAVFMVALLAAPGVQAVGGSCNASCQVNDDCSTGMRCYVGVCRNTQCPASATCGCSASPSPVSTTRPTATPRTTSTPKPTTTPTPTPKTATPSAKVASSSGLKRTPETGFETLIPVGVAFGLYLAGSTLSHKKTQ